VRLRPAGFTGTPKPKDEPLAENPPDGAILDYWLAAAPAKPVTLEILDASGETVESYTSAEAPRPVDPARLRTAPEWVRPPAPLSAEPGMHRFVWPLHYAQPEALGGGRGGFFGGGGAWAPPGTYRAVLTVDGKRLEQPLTVAPDPRVEGMTPADYRAELELARKVEALRARVETIADQVGKLTRTVAERRADEPAEVRGAMDALLAKLAALAGNEVSANPSNTWWLPPKSVDSIRYLGGALGELQRAVDGADAPPSPDAKAGYAKLSELVENLESAWKGVQTGELAAVDAKLKAAGREPLGGAR
jgi:hypothetical protein